MKLNILLSTLLLVFTMSYTLTASSSQSFEDVSPIEIPIESNGHISIPCSTVSDVVTATLELKDVHRLLPSDCFFPTNNDYFFGGIFSVVSLVHSKHLALQEVLYNSQIKVMAKNNKANDTIDGTDFKNSENQDVLNQPLVATTDVSKKSKRKYIGPAYKKGLDVSEVTGTKSKLITYKPKDMSDAEIDKFLKKNPRFKVWWTEEIEA